MDSKSFNIDEPLTPEEQEELIAAIIETMRNNGWKVPEWIGDRCREKIAVLRAREFIGQISFSFEVWYGQVADIDIIEKAEDKHDQ
jgi:hypothetical protein